MLTVANQVSIDTVLLLLLEVSLGLNMSHVKEFVCQWLLLFDVVV